MNYRVEDFERLFENGELSFLVSTLFLEVYRRLGALVTFRHRWWRAYLPLLSVEQAGAEGLALYSDKQAYEQLGRDLETAFQTVSATYGAFLGSSSGSAKELKDCIDAAVEYLRLYQKLEFFYTDVAYANRDTSSLLAENLTSFGELKNKGRERLNAIYFGENAYFPKLVQKIARDTKTPAAVVETLSIEELVPFYEGAITPPSRETKSFMSWYEAGKLQHLFGEEAEAAVLAFQGEAEDSTALTGRTAHGGKVTARARVHQYLVSEFDSASAWVEAMRDGEVLVAETTSPEIILACKKASAIVTNQGGMMSHAAIVARELGIPCVVGTGTATHVIKTGDLVEVDADAGTVRIIQ